jgi:hypothetical protein
MYILVCTHLHPVAKVSAQTRPPWSLASFQLSEKTTRISRYSNFSEPRLNAAVDKAMDGPTGEGSAVRRVMAMHYVMNCP